MRGSSHQPIPLPTGYQWVGIHTVYAIVEYPTRTSELGSHLSAALLSSHLVCPWGDCWPHCLHASRRHTHTHARTHRFWMVLVLCCTHASNKMAHTQLSSESANIYSLDCTFPAPITALDYSHAPMDRTHTQTLCSTAVHSSASPHSAGTYRHVRNIWKSLCG